MLRDKRRFRADETADVEAQRVEAHSRHGGVVHARYREPEHDGGAEHARSRWPRRSSVHSATPLAAIEIATREGDD